MTPYDRPRLRRDLRSRPRAVATARSARAIDVARLALLVAALFALLALAGALAPRAAWSRDAAPMPARAGLDLAEAAAHAWAPDAFLVYLENDEPLDVAGSAPRWGYLFLSPSRDRSRAYSVRGGRIVTAEDLDMRFDAPPVAADWIDSGTALRAAEPVAREFLRASGASLATMLLVRGAFHDDDPDATTWTLVFRAPGAPALFVVVDAASGAVRRTWRG